MIIAQVPDPNSRQVGGDHYIQPIQPWDYIAANELGFFEGNIVKYVTRCCTCSRIRGYQGVPP